MSTAVRLQSGGTLDPHRQTSASCHFELALRQRIVGQDEAVQALVELYQVFCAGLNPPGRPIGNLLFLGPTGVGKTRIVEAATEILFGDSRALIKVDCAEFQHSHEISKLIGSPPGYLGHRETHPAIEQEKLDKFHTEALKLSIVLFDEIEKANDALWSLLLGILDNGTLTLGDNRIVDLTKTVIILTSNLGAREMTKNTLGFTALSEERDQARLDQIALSAAKSKFSPEFMNRIENVVTFKKLLRPDVEQILDIEFLGLSKSLNSCIPIELYVSPAAKEALLEAGYSEEYGARHLKRVLDIKIMKPLAKIYNSSQLTADDTVIVDYRKDFEFYVEPKK